MFPISHFNITRTPFYYYDKTLLSNTLAKLAWQENGIIIFIML